MDNFPTQQQHQYVLLVFVFSDPKKLSELLHLFNDDYEYHDNDQEARTLLAGVTSGKRSASPTSSNGTFYKMDTKSRDSVHMIRHMISEEGTVINIFSDREWSILQVLQDRRKIRKLCTD